MRMKEGETKAASRYRADGAVAGSVRYIDVGIGETVVSRDRSAVLVACGMGSCVGVCVYDPILHSAGMAHVLLPGDGPDENIPNDLRYAGVAVPKLIRRMKKSGTPEHLLVVKIAGGANVVKTALRENNIGYRNVCEIRRILGELKCRVAAEDVLGEKGRTIRFSVMNGELSVTSAGRSAKTVTI